MRKRSVRKSSDKPNSHGYRKQSRKEKRRDGRKMVKVRNLANSMKKPVSDVINNYYTPVQATEQEIDAKDVDEHFSENEEIEERPVSPDEDERAERFYARKLGMHKNKRKGLPKIFAESGMDYILELCDLKTTNKPPKIEQHPRKGLKIEKEIVEEIESTEELNLEDEEDLYGRIDGKIDDHLTNERMEFMEKMEKEDSSSESMDKMRKQMRGVVNRLSEGSLPASVKLVQTLYSSHKHNDVKRCVSECLMQSICVDALLPVRLSIQYSTFLAALHSFVSPQISSHLLEECANRFKEYFNTDRTNVDDKSCRNLLVFVCYLINLKVVESKIILEMLNVLKDKFTESCIANILLIMTHGGFSLRKGNPSGLKDFIVEIQSKVVSDEGESMKQKSSVRFMFETVLAVKNNNLFKVSGYDNTLVEHFNKLLKGMAKGNPIEDPHTMGLYDLWEAEDKGRWWIVGSAWNPSKTGPSNKTKKEGKKMEFTDELIQMAKKHRMSTQLRVNIFCTLMSSQDCDDCLFRLLKLGLRGSKEREIIHVTMTCALKQKTYNPFYAVLLHKLCSHHKRFKLTTQYAIWDRVKELTELKQVQRKNLSALIANLLLSDTLNLTVFKVIRFAQLDRASSSMMRRILRELLMKCSEEKLKSMCSVTVASSKNGLLVEGLQLFVQHAFLTKQPPHVLESKAAKLYSLLAPLDMAAL